MPAQADTFWHLRAGQEIWQTLRVPFEEHYSHTAAGRYWPNHEWLWQAASYGLVRLGGLPLLLVTAAAMIVGAVVIIHRLMGGTASARFWILAAGLPLSASVWALRPQIVSLLFFALLLWLLVSERTYWLPPLFALWANVHGAVVLGVAVLTAVAVAAIVSARLGGVGTPEARQRRRRAVTLAVLLPVCVLATAATPMGFALWRFIAVSMSYSRQTGIGEWTPAYPTGFIEIGFWVLALAFVALVVARRRQLAGAQWPTVVLVVAAAVVLPLAVRAVRNIAPFLLAAVPAASRLFDLARPAPTSKPSGGAEHPRVNLALLMGISLVEAAIVVTAWVTAHPKLGWRPMSPAAVAAVRSCPDPLYNRYDDGGFLIWFVPENRVFVDSRQDPYPLPFLLEHIGVENGDLPYRPMFERHRIGCAFVPSGGDMAARLGRDGWRQRFADERWAVLTRPGSGE